MAKKRTSALLLTVGTAVVLTVGGGLAYWFLRQRGPGVGGEALQTLELVPQNALATLSVSTNPDQWRTVRSLGNADTQAQFNEQLGQWRDRLLTDTGLDYQEDVRPWIGEKATLVFFPPASDGAEPSTGEASEPTDSDPTDPDASAEGDPSPSSSDDSAADGSSGTAAEAETDNGDDAAPDATPDPELLDPSQAQAPALLLPIADPLQARSTLQEALGDGGEGETRDYNGIEIQELPRENEPSYFAAVIDRQTIVLTRDTTSIEQVIDTHLGGPSVMDIDGYTQAAQTVAIPQSFLDLYVNSAAAAAVTAAGTIQGTPPPRARCLAGWPGGRRFCRAE